MEILQSEELQEKSEELKEKTMRQTYSIGSK